MTILLTSELESERHKCITWGELMLSRSEMRTCRIWSLNLEKMVLKVCEKLVN